MGWIVWLVLTAAVFVVGGLLMRRGTPHVAKYCTIVCVVLFVATLFKLGHAFGPGFAPLPWMLFSVLAPGTIFFLFWAAKRDRALVMGAAGKRDAHASAAIMYGAGAGAMHEGGGGGGGMES